MRPLNQILISLELAAKYLTHYHQQLDQIKADLGHECYRAISCRTSLTMVQRAGAEIKKKIDAKTDAYLGKKTLFTNHMIRLPEALALTILELEHAIALVTQAPAGTYDRNITFRLRMAFGHVCKVSRVEFKEECFVDNKEAEFAVIVREEQWKRIA